MITKIGVKGQMLENKIERLQNLLNDAIECNRDYKLIYDLSVQLDELIVTYYKKIGLKVS